MRRILALFLLPFLFSCTASRPPTARPAPAKPYVRDTIRLLTQNQSAEIENLLAEHNAKGPGRLYLTIVEKLPPHTTLEKFARAKINEEPFKPNEKNDRILFLIAYKSRKLRIETSREVWPILTDAYCKSVIDKEILPHFKEGKFYLGIKLALQRLIKKLEQGK